MKPRTAVATFILAALADLGDGPGRQGLYDHAEGYKQNDGPLTAKQKARVDGIFADYVAKLTALMAADGAEVGTSDQQATAPFDGDDGVKSSCPGIAPGTVYATSEGIFAGELSKQTAEDAADIQRLVAFADRTSGRDVHVHVHGDVTFRL